MRIGIDGGCLANRRGFGRYARQVLSALAEARSPHEFLVFVDRPSWDRVTIPSAFEGVVVEVRQAPSQAASATGRRSARDLLAMGRAAARARLDLMYFPASYSFFPVWNVGRLIVTMHDTLALSHPELVFPSWQGRLAWMLKEYAAVARADRILTDSEASRRDLIAWFRLSPDRVGIVPGATEPCFRPLAEGPESDRVLRRHGIATGLRFLLYVGGLSPHKNLPRLVEAFARSAPPDVLLVLVGDHGDVFHTHLPALRDTIARHRLDGRVLLPGYVPDSDLVYLYNRAYALVQPSLMEGFGLPPVEAMACGTPVLSSNAGSLPEVVGEAGMFFDPTEVHQIAATIRLVLDDPHERQRLAILALRRARRFTKQAMAVALLDCFARFSQASTTRKSA
jgi:glycosyltransferase involved in cell wall biosynthesis